MNDRPIDSATDSPTDLKERASMKEAIEKSDLATENVAEAQFILSCIDLTDLSDDLSRTDIERLCARADTPHGPVAAVCLKPRFVDIAFEHLRHNTIRIATVINFPDGDGDRERIIHQAVDLVNAGAQELDLVFPYEDFLAGREEKVRHLLDSCRQAVGSDITLKIIMETAAFNDHNTLRRAADLALMSGCDFLKTSTGQYSGGGATLETSAVLLQAIRERESDSNSSVPVGFKASGGIRTLKGAVQFKTVVAEMMGEEWLNPHLFRVGASMLLDDILGCLNPGSDKKIEENIESSY